MATKCPSCGAQVASVAQALVACQTCQATYVSGAPAQLGIQTRGSAGALVEAGLVALPPAFHKQYRLGRVLGQGAMGMVVKGQRVADARVVAIKFLTRSDDADRARFQREGELMREVRHKNVVEIFEVLDLEGYRCLITEFVGGGTLRARMERPPPLTPDDALRVAARALAGLAACHDAGIVHRDVKPENLLFSESGDIKVADLGIARATDATRLTATGAILGTPRYMSPEQALGEVATPASDVYALSAVLYEMLAARPLFAANSLVELLESHIATPPDPLAKVAPHVPKALAAAVHSGLAKLPAERPADARAFARLLAASRDSGKSGPTPEAEPAAPLAKPPRPAPVAQKAAPAFIKTSVPAARPRSNWPILLASGAVALVLAVAFTVLQMFIRPPPVPAPPSPVSTPEPDHSAAPPSLPPAPTPAPSPSPRARPSPRPKTSPRPASPKPRPSPPASPPPPAAPELPASAPTPDGSVMLLIPAGRFTMGMKDRPDAPERDVTLSAYYLDRTEITNAQYDSFTGSTRYRTFWEREGKGNMWTGGSWQMTPGVNWRHPNAPDEGIAGEAQNAPVAQLTWMDAQAYCLWAGKRLPTEAEWEKGARGGVDGALYPWGDDAPSEARAWFNRNYKEGPHRVGSHPPNGYGLYDCLGNVREWVADLYDPEIAKLCLGTDPTGTIPGLSSPPMQMMRGSGFTNRGDDLPIGNRGFIFVPYADYATGVRGARTDAPRPPEPDLPQLSLKGAAGIAGLLDDLIALTDAYPRPGTLDAASACMDTASMLMLVQRNAEARRLLERAVEIRTRRLGADHPQTVLAALHAANTEVAHPDPARWRDVHERARRAFGETHPLTAAAASTLAATAFMSGDVAQARSAFAAAHRALDGPSTPHRRLLLSTLIAEAAFLRQTRDAAGFTTVVQRARTLTAGMNAEDVLVKQLDLLTGAAPAAKGQ